MGFPETFTGLVLPNCLPQVNQVVGAFPGERFNNDNM
jgi:hypothetical protein